VPRSTVLHYLARFWVRGLTWDGPPADDARERERGGVPCRQQYTYRITTRLTAIAEIYAQRQVELFATGLRWEDVRRQGLVSATSAYAKRCWLLYANADLSTQPNVPISPADDPPVTFSKCGI